MSWALHRCGGAASPAAKGELYAKRGHGDVTARKHARTTRRRIVAYAPLKFQKEREDMNKNRTPRGSVAVAAAVPLVLLGLSAPVNAAELAPVAGALDHLVAAASGQLA
jgi:hypothetical protein